jgi:alanyl-tRNA synthetase
VRHTELLRGTDRALAGTLVAATDAVSSVMGRRWSDVGPGSSGDVARDTIEREAHTLRRTLRRGADRLRQQAQDAASFDGDLAFHLADTMGYPSELSVEDATRLGMTFAEGWEARYEALREAQRTRSRDG